MPSEKIEAIFKNKSGKYLLTIKGEIKNNVFIYKENSLFGVLGGDEKTIKVNEDGIQEIAKNKRVIIYKSNGSDFIQEMPISETDKQIRKSESAYRADSEISRLKKDSMLTKPAGLKALLEFLLVVMIIVAIIGIYFLVTTATGRIQQSYTPLQNITNQNTRLTTYLINESKNQSRLCSVALQYFIKIGQLNPTSPLSG